MNRAAARIASFISLRNETRRNRQSSQARALKQAFLNATLETLEARRLLTTYYVDDFSDATTGAGNNGTLRWAVAQANTNPGDDTIQFNATSWPQTITLTATNGPISINDSSSGNLSILGPGQGNLTISGGGNTGLLINYSNSTIKNLTLTKANGANLPNWGGAIYNSSCLSIEDVIISNCSGSYGGAIVNCNDYNGCSISMSNSTITDCTASYGAGALLNEAYGGTGATVSVVIRNSSIVNISVAQYGAAAIMNVVGGNKATILIENSTIANCTTTGSAGAILNYGGGNLTISQSTIAYNHADDRCGGIINTSDSKCHIYNSILANNTAKTGGQNLNGVFDDLKYDLISSVDYNAGVDGVGYVINPNARLGNLGNYGGPIQTIPLLPGSSAIGAGSGFANVTTDQRGYTPPVSYTGYADIGAFQTSGQLGGNITVNSDVEKADYGQITLRQALNLVNQWAGCAETVNFAKSMTATGNTTITLLDSAQCYGPISINAPGNTTRIIGPSGANSVTVSGGNTTGIFNISSPAIISNLSVKNGNGAGLPNGGAIYNNHTDLMLESMIFSNNTGPNGGAVFNDGYYGASCLTINNSTLSTNSAGDRGGAVHNFGVHGNATLSINNSNLSENNAPYGGGAIVNDGVWGTAMISIKNSRFFRNHTQGDGGVIDNLATEGFASVTFENSVASDNDATGYGGVFYNKGYYGKADLQINNSTLNNSNSAYGGAIASYGPNGNASVKITSSTLAYNNSVESGGAIYNYGNYGNATLFLKNSTLARNESYMGGGIYDVYGNLTAHNSIIANNVSLYTSTTADLYGVIDDSQYSLYSTPVSIAFDTGSIQNANPKLGTLGYYGGPTPTIPLLPGSPAIGAGLGLANTTTDQRGYKPPASYTGNADIGAFQTGGQFSGNIAITSLNEITMPISMTSGMSIIATGGSPMGYAITAGNLPAGVTLDPATGLLSGTPAPGTAGTYPITIQAANGVGSPATQNFTLKIISTITGFTVSRGQSQRSYIRYLDLGMDSNASALWLKNNPGRIRLTKADLNGVGSANVPLAGFISVPQGSSTLAIDFGTVGLGNSRNTNAADGYYTLGLDLDGNGTFETDLYFYRIFGDTNGDGQVTASDQSTVLAGCTVAYNSSLDLNGDGIVNTSDYQYVKKAVGRKLKSGLIVTS